ncbi:uncharacterized protein BKCO1_4000063 [Diplodia corticola]|uniref:Secreted protein CSS2 C-terminal domain-containing protein n=1 Tax=Diplodia corticola TaxID=236234 RepID=A0A1J9QW03_9PEZI|nr:uncharacterized protein BKCO1_4000063 [Diplodia corticola]OJD32178.1 hypothetical protein BKCO1_4000063 [Diplodia corticola]
MHITLPAFALALLALGSSASTLPAKRSLPQKRATHYAELDLVQFGPNSTEIEKRKSIKYCFTGPSEFAACIAVADFTQQLAFNIASQFKGDSDNNDCSGHSGSLDSVVWYVYATTSGSRCDTTAELGTFQGAIEKYIRGAGGEICDVHCIRLTHDGTFTGWLALAPDGQTLDRSVCDATVFDTGATCDTGGKNDV